MIQSDKLIKIGIDYEAGLIRFMNDLNLYEAVLRAFLSEDILSRAKYAFDNHDMILLLKVIHEAKGSSGNAGFDELYQVSSAFVALLRAKSYTENELMNSYHRFVDVYEKVYHGVKASIED